MLVVRGPSQAGLFDALGNVASSALHSVESIVEAPIKVAGGIAGTAIRTVGGVATTAIGTAGSVVGTGIRTAGGVAGQGLSTVGGVLANVRGALHPAGAVPTLPPGAIPPPSNTPYIVAGIGVALLLGLVLFSRPRASAPAPVAA